MKKISNSAYQIKTKIKTQRASQDVPEPEGSPAVENVVRKRADNPKRRQRNARKQLESSGIGTRSQQALAKQREEMKIERRQQSREQLDMELKRRYE